MSFQQAYESEEFQALQPNTQKLLIDRFLQRRTADLSDPVIDQLKTRFEERFPIQTFDRPESPAAPVDLATIPDGTQAAIQLLNQDTPEVTPEPEKPGFFQEVGNNLLNEIRQTRMVTRNRQQRKWSSCVTSLRHRTKAVVTIFLIRQFFDRRYSHFTIDFG